MSLHIHKHRKIRFTIVSAMVMVLFVVAVFIVNKSNNSFAAITYELPEGYTTFTDPDFYDCVAEEYAREFPDEEVPATGLTDEQLGRIKKLYCSYYDIYWRDKNLYSNVVGLEKMTGLVTVEMYIPADLEYTDFSNQISLKKLTLDQLCGTSECVELNLNTSNNSSLEELSINSGGLKSLDLSHNFNLKNLKIDAELESLDLSYNTNLIKLDVKSMIGTELNLSNNTALEELTINIGSSQYPLDTIDLSNNTSLKYFKDDNYWSLSTIDFSNNNNLEEVILNNYLSRLTSIKVPEQPTLKTFKMFDARELPKNALEDLFAVESLETLVLQYYFALEALDVSNLVNLKALSVTNGHHLSSVVFSDNNNNIEGIDLSNNFITSLDTSPLVSLEGLNIVNNDISTLDLRANHNLQYLLVDDATVRANIIPETVSSNRIASYDLTEANFGGLRIEDSDNYLWDSTSKKLTVNDYSQTSGYIEPALKNAYYDDYHSFKLQLPKFIDYVTNSESDIDSTSCYSDFDDLTRICSVLVTDDVPVRDGYMFLGWADSANALAPDYVAGDTIFLSEPKAIYAVWSPIHTLEFNLNGGSDEIETQSCYSSPVISAKCRVTIPSTTPTRNGYVFLGWGTEAGASEAIKQPGDEIMLPLSDATITEASTTTLYAIWASIYTLNFDMNTEAGETVEGVDSVSCHPNTPSGTCSVAIPTTRPIREGYKLFGYVDSADAVAPIYSLGSTYTFTEGDYNKTIYAVWGEGQPTQVVTFNDSSATITKTYGDAKFTNAASTNGDGDVSYSSSNTNVATVNSSTGEVTIVGVGETTITANASETGNYNEGSADYTLTVNKAERTLTFTSGNTITKTYGDNEFINAATKNGDNDANITYTVTAGAGVATVNSDTGKVTINSAGTATITASIPATNNYTGASASYTLTVNKANPNFAFTNTAVSKVFGDANFTNAVTTNSDGVVTYASSDTAIATVNSSTGEVTIIKSGGPITITANITATNNYNGATATYTLMVSQYPSAISFTNTSITKTYGDANFINAATTTSTSPIVYTSSNTSVATVNSSTGEVTIIKASGTPIIITASVAASSNYAEASTSYTLTINKKNSSIPTEITEANNGQTAKTGQTGDKLSTITLTTTGLTWENENETIRKGQNSYRVRYTENQDNNNYTTESFDIIVTGEGDEEDTNDTNNTANTTDTDNTNGTDFVAVPNTGVGANIEVIVSVMTSLITIAGFITTYIIRIKKQRSEEHRKFD